MFVWIKNLHAFFYERRYRKCNLFKTSKDFTISIYFAFFLPFIILVIICIYNYINGIMKFSKQDPFFWLIYTILFLFYPTCSSLGQYIGVDKESIWIRFGFIRCKKIPKRCIKECYIVNGVDFERHLIGETLIIKSNDDKNIIYVSNRYTHQQRDEIAKLLGYENGLKSLKIKNIEKY